MAIPSFKVFLRPTLELICDLQEVSRSKIVQLVREKLQFTDEESNERIASGQNRLQNRVGWAVTYLKKSGLISIPRKSVLSITEDGKQFLVNHAGAISPKDLMQFEGYVEFLNEKNKNQQETFNTLVEDLDPEEKIDIGFNEIKNNVISELRAKLYDLTPLKFEVFVLDLIRALGYGAKTGDIKHTGGSGDGGIDGIIHLDRLGLDKIYLQAKRYQTDNKISRAEIQQFFGAIKGKQASKGIFLTTSSYQASAIEYANTVSDTLILLDGNDIADLMIEAEVGVSTKRKILIPTINNDYFDE